MAAGTLFNLSGRAALAASLAMLAMPAFAQTGIELPDELKAQATAAPESAAPAVLAQVEGHGPGGRGGWRDGGGQGGGWRGGGGAATEGGQGGWQGRGNWGGARGEAAPQPAPAPVAQVPQADTGWGRNRGNWQGGDDWRGRNRGGDGTPGGGWTAPAVPTPPVQAEAPARNWQGGGEWRGRNRGGDSTPGGGWTAPAAPVPPAQAEAPGRNWQGGNGWRGRNRGGEGMAGGGWTAPAAPVPPVQSEVPNRNWQGGGNRVDGNRQTWRGDRRGEREQWRSRNEGSNGWRSNEGQWRNDGQRWSGNRSERQGGNAWRGDNGWNGDRRWSGNNGTWRGNNGWTGDRRWSGNTNGWRGNENRYGYGYGNGWNNNYRRWNHDWRRDNRYNWYSYRNVNRNVFRLGRYYAPYRGYSYSRLSIGFYLDSLFFAQNYWISDPWQYRLPEVYGPYRWIRYYDDAVLVDIYSGEVVDVIHDFFW